MKLTSETYVAEVLRTDCPITPELIERLSQTETIRLLHATMGLVTEAAELADMLKKHIFYGRKLDMVNAAEELGDSHWYAGLAVDVLKTTMNDILTMNISKLRLRYPEKFTEADAENRDVAAERVLLEEHHSYEGVSDAEYRQMNNLRPLPSLLSARGEDWAVFSDAVLAHIENYTVPQYGDKGQDQASDWSVPMLIEQAKKYANRHGKSAREGQELLDFMKGAHYTQMAMTKFIEGGSNEAD